MGHLLSIFIPQSRKGKNGKSVVLSFAALSYRIWTISSYKPFIIGGVRLLFVDLIHSAPQTSSIRAPAEKAVAGIGAVLTVWGVAANRFRQRLLLEARDMWKNDPEVDRALNFHHLFLL